MARVHDQSRGFREFCRYEECARIRGVRGIRRYVHACVAVEPRGYSVAADRLRVAFTVCVVNLPDVASTPRRTGMCTESPAMKQQPPIAQLLYGSPGVARTRVL